RAYIALYTAIMICALIFSQSRGGWAAFAVMIILASAVLSSQHISIKNSVKDYAFLILIIIIAGIASGGEMLQNRIMTMGQDLPLRLEIWSNSLQIFKDNWLTGVGAGNFQFIYPYYADNFGHKDILHAHSDYIELLVEQGVVGFSLIGAAVFFTCLSAVKTILNKTGGSKSAYAFASVMAITGFMVHATVEFNFQVPSNAIYFFIFLAIAAMQGDLEEEKRDVAWEEAIFKETHEPTTVRRKTRRHLKAGNSAGIPLSE
ncbi:MAG: O-antigen ligase family protein, partial [Gammaproteobacteria bacterium]|nr:O-antigen ligase family protein [Gammaproteobacteria bacterium]